MCGIIFTDLKGRATKRLLKRYNKQQHRGKEGYGCVSIDNGIIKNIYRSKQEGEIRRMMKNDNSGTMLFHHRKPTSTPNLESCTHPIYVSNNNLKFDYYVCHNGVISNAKSLKLDFEKIGYEYTTEVEELLRPKHGPEIIQKEMFNDSESFAIDLAIAIEEGKTLVRSVGSIAFIALQFNKENGTVRKVFFGRDHKNPLKIDSDNDELILASEGSGSMVEPNKLFSYDLKTKKIEERYLNIGPIVHTPVVIEVSNETKDPMGFAPRPKEQIITEGKTKDETVIEELLKPQPGHRVTYPDIVKNNYSPKSTAQSHLIEYFNSNGDEKRVRVVVMDGFIYKTKILWEDHEKIMHTEWEEYDQLLKDFNGNCSIFIESGKVGITLSREEIQEINDDLRQIEIRFSYLTEMANKRKAIMAEVK